MQGQFFELVSIQQPSLWNPCEFVCILNISLDSDGIGISGARRALSPRIYANWEPAE